MEFDNEFFEKADEAYQRLKDEGFKSLKDKERKESLKRALADYDSRLMRGY